MVHSRPLFVYFRLFTTFLLLFDKIVSEWIQTRVLWRWREKVYQRCLNCVRGRLNMCDFKAFLD